MNKSGPPTDMMFEEMTVMDLAHELEELEKQLSRERFGQCRDWVVTMLEENIMEVQNELDYRADLEEMASHNQD